MARKLGCSVFLLPEDIIEVMGHCYEINNMLYITKDQIHIFPVPYDVKLILIQVNQKMILTLTASIMYWSLQKPQQPETSEQSESSCAASDAASDIASEDATSIMAASEGEEVNSLPDRASNMPTDDTSTSEAPAFLPDGPAPT